MTKQLGDQGGLSKNLQKEREGEGYGETKAGAGVGCSGSTARELVANWSNSLRPAEAQVLGGLTWLPPGMGGSLLLGLCIAEDLQSAAYMSFS